MDLCVLLAPQQDINWEEITPAVPHYGHWECAFPWEIACIRSRRSNKNQGHWRAEIDSVGALVCQILRTLYWIRNRLGTSLIFYFVFLKFTFLNFFLMYLWPSSRKWFHKLDPVYAHSEDLGNKIYRPQSGSSCWIPYMLSVHGEATHRGATSFLLVNGNHNVAQFFHNFPKLRWQV